MNKYICDTNENKIKKERENELLKLFSTKYFLPCKYEEEKENKKKYRVNNLWLFKFFHIFMHLNKKNNLFLFYRSLL